MADSDSDVDLTESLASSAPVSPRGATPEPESPSWIEHERQFYGAATPVLRCRTPSAPLTPEPESEFEPAIDDPRIFYFVCDKCSTTSTEFFECDKCSLQAMPASCPDWRVSAAEWPSPQATPEPERRTATPGAPSRKRSAAKMLEGILSHDPAYDTERVRFLRKLSRATSEVEAFDVDFSVTVSIRRF